MDWLRDRIMGRRGVTMRAEDRHRLEELKARTRRAERQTAILRHAREQGDPTRRDALDNLWGLPPWRDER